MCVQRKVFVTRKVPQPGIELLEGAGCNVELWDSDEAIPREELIRGISGAHALFCMLTDTIDGKVLDAAGVQAVKDGQWGKWKPMWLCGMELAQKTVGILGLGRIGFGVARRLKPFGVKKIVYHDVCRVGYADDIGASFVEFDKLLIESDVICICCNLTPQTKQRFNKSAFKKMKRHAILVNSGRGGVIKHDDLLEALTSGEIAAAGLDVTEPEPLPADHPLVHQPNCIVLPHMGSNTWDSRNSMSETTANNILSVFNDQTATGLVQ
ncbi:glyoxylate reductase/hydroxypyruvate reductase-like isoform X2 [Mercenaria mercenaria]|uniref:glyoxylate reductase/hydroxypyruvate reductase-like isoform X2 n=1 Tax=Mercenaria mercenaria TaxID=6596 RepID=UPI00234EB53A|nr:glyoxylate reductase/hydroxypyruvate reductase-like isoform X2 [Mercenaria mercenaria]